MREDHEYIFIDFEFTMPDRSYRNKGFFPEIIETGAVLVKGNKIIEQFSSFVTPIHFPVLTHRCKSFLNITQRQVDHGISLKDLIMKLEKMTTTGMDQTIVTWGNMDMKVLRRSCERSNLHFPFRGKEVDLSMEYKRFFGDQNQTGLWKAVQEYGKEGTGRHHRALDDALTTYHIFKLVEKDKQYLKKPEPTTIGDLIDAAKLFNRLA